MRVVIPSRKRVSYRVSVRRAQKSRSVKMLKTAASGADWQNPENSSTWANPENGSNVKNPENS